MKSKKNLNHISKVVMKKSTAYIKISIVSFVISIIILSIAIILSWNQYQQIKCNFINNVNTHVIEISGRYQAEKLENENIQYLEDIERLLKYKFEDEDVQIFAMYQFPYGLDAVGIDEPINVFAVDPAAQKYILSDAKMEDGILYSSADNKMKTCTFFVPKVSVSKYNLHLYDEKSYTLHFSDAELNDIFDTYDSLGIDPYFISYSTYSDLFKYSFGENLSISSFEKYQDVKLVYKVYAYVSDITKVEKIAKIINKEGYLTNFVFQSFENIGEELGASLMIMLLISIIVMICTLISLFMSLKGYIQLVSKDIGILKQMGYPSDYVEKIYSINLRKMFLKISLISMLVVGTIAVAILGSNEYAYIIIHLISINAILICTYMISKWVFLKKKVHEDILTLLKLNKAFE